VETTNEFEDEAAAPRGAVRGQNKTVRNAVMCGIVGKILSIPTAFV